MLEETKAGPVLRLRVRTRAQRDEVLGEEGGVLRVVVREAPERGKANEAVIRTVARWLGVPRSSLELLSGGSARDKRVLVHGMTAEQVRARLSKR